MISFPQQHQQVMLSSTISAQSMMPLAPLPVSPSSSSSSSSTASPASTSTGGMKRRLDDSACTSPLPSPCHDDTLRTTKRQRRAKKTVRFACSRNTVTRCAGSLWMSKSELTACKQDIQTTIRTYHQSEQDITRLDAASICLRGLEDVLTPQAFQQSQSKRKQHARNVLKAQSLLRSMNGSRSDEQTCLRYIAQQSSLEATRVALRRGALDAMDFSVLLGL